MKDIIKSGTRDKAEGGLHEMKGKVKKVAGKLTDNPKLEVEGTAEKDLATQYAKDINGVTDVKNLMTIE